jgi:hypothetical protein
MTVLLFVIVVRPPSSLCGLVAMFNRPEIAQPTARSRRKAIFFMRNCLARGTFFEGLVG